MTRSRNSKNPPKAAGKGRRSESGRGWRKPLRWLGLFVLAFILSSCGSVLLFRFVPPPITPLMAIRAFGHWCDGREPALRKAWKPLEKISPRLAEAVVASEDQRFFDHRGFDLKAIRSAVEVNSRGRRKLGASTITQQTAKNLFLWPDRGWTRKGLEAYFTLLLELLWSKERILETYLNIIELGDGIYGAEAAAQVYFGIPAASLGREQAAMLAAVLPNPRKWSPANPTSYLHRRQAWILRQVDRSGPLPGRLSRGGPARRRPSPLPRPVLPVPPAGPAGDSIPIPDAGDTGAPAADSGTRVLPGAFPAPVDAPPDPETALPPGSGYDSGIGGEADPGWDDPPPYPDSDSLENP